MQSVSRPSRLVVIAVVLFALLLLHHEWRLLPDGRTHIYFLDVGQGDAALIVTPGGKTIVIDGGPNLAALEQIGERRPFLNRRIDMLVLSHPHLDHLASFPELLTRYDVRSVVLTGMEHDLPRYARMLALMRARRIPGVSPVTVRDIDFGDGVRMELLWPTAKMLREKPKDINDTSIVARISDGDDSVLFTGDIEQEAERAILASGIDVDADILKVAHHGSRGSSSTGFLLAVSPDVAVISSGKGNSYGHPHAQALGRLQHFGIPVRRTDMEGTVEVVWD